MSNEPIDRCRPAVSRRRECFDSVMSTVVNFTHDIKFEYEGSVCVSSPVYPEGTSSKPEGNTFTSIFRQIDQISMVFVTQQLNLSPPVILSMSIKRAGSNFRERYVNIKWSRVK